MPEISVGTPAPATTNGAYKVGVHWWKLFAFQFFQRLAAGVGPVRQFPHEHFGKALPANLELFQLVVNLGRDCELDSSHELTIHEQCTKARRNGVLFRGVCPGRASACLAKLAGRVLSWAVLIPAVSASLGDNGDGRRKWVAPDWLLGLALVAAVLLAFQPAWRGGFIWDDDVYVTNNPLLTAPDGLWRIWFSLDSPSQYFPLTYTSFYLERAFWGLNPAGYHWVNLLLHAANALLVWRLLGRLRVPGAWLAAGIFALHPVQVESVAWITERKNVLMAFFFLLTLLAWIEFIEEKTERPWRFYALALVCYALALFAKTTACTLPAALLLLLWLEKNARWLAAAGAGGAVCGDGCRHGSGDRLVGASPSRHPGPIV